MRVTNKNKSPILIPADVADFSRNKYIENYQALTQGTSRFFMFAADQKIEHLNTDFYGPGIDPQVNDPKHIFNIAQQGSVGALATHAGLIARYGKQYQDINYIVKLNGKTNLGDPHVDPVSQSLLDIHDVLDLSAHVNDCIRGIGYTLYVGSAYEHLMMSEASHLIAHAHNLGLVAVLWIYVRGPHLKDPCKPDYIAGAAGLGNALGADFVKVNIPNPTNTLTCSESLKVACTAAGNTGVICSGGPSVPTKDLLARIYEQIHQGDTRGCAIGRNIFQRNLEDAVNLTKAISAIVYQNAPLNEAIALIETAIM